MSLESIDTSYWKTKDKSWKEERLAQWPAIERVLVGNRRKSEVNVIKQYFLRGKMPKWENYRDWNGFWRHVDLDKFLWLHPSDDPEVLNALYKRYMESDLVHELDVIHGYGSFLDHEFMRATSHYSLKEYPFPYRGDKNIIMFRIMFADLEYVKERIIKLVGGKENFEKKAVNIFDSQGYSHFFFMRNWLMQGQASPLARYCLYQYDDVLTWCLTTLSKDKEKKFHKSIEYPVNIELYQKVFYCFLHFDTEKEGDTGRSRFIPKIKKILDENEFIPEFKQIWEEVKAGKVEVKDPWKI